MHSISHAAASKPSVSVARLVVPFDHRPAVPINLRHHANPMTQRIPTAHSVLIRSSHCQSCVAPVEGTIHAGFPAQDVNQLVAATSAPDVLSPLEVA